MTTGLHGSTFTRNIRTLENSYHNLPKISICWLSVQTIQQQHGGIILYTERFSKTTVQSQTVAPEKLQFYHICSLNGILVPLLLTVTFFPMMH